MPRFTLRTLGGLALHRTEDGEGDAFANSRSLLILAILATREGYTARRDELAELLWPGGDRSRALRALRQALFHLGARGDAVLRRDDDVLALDPDAVTVDLWEFERAIEAEDFAQALAFYQGRFAEGQERKVGTELEHWIEGVNARLNIGLEVAYAREIDRHSRSGAAETAVGLAREFVRLNPLDDERQHLLMQTLAAAGDRVGALQAFEGYRHLVEQDLGDAVPAALAERFEAMRRELLRSAGEPPTEAPPPPPRPAVPSHDTAALIPLVAGAVVGTALLVVTVLGAPAAGPRTSALATLDARLLVTVERGRPELLEAALSGAGVETRPSDGVEPGEVPAPDGHMLALSTQAPDGWNLAIRPAGSHDITTLTSEPGDEYPVSWSPDGRRVLYTRRRLLADGRTYTHALALYDVAADTGWTLSPLESTERPAASWSPDGTRIAFTADVQGIPDVFVVPFDGSDRRNVTAHAAWDGDPAWAPDGHRIAFVSRRHGAGDLYTVRPDGTGLQRVTETPAPVSHPRWISPTTVVLLAGRDGARDLWAVHTFTGDLQQLTRTRDYAAIVAVLGNRAPWIERLTITPRTAVGSPGQHLAFRPRMTSAGGEELPEDAIPISWFVSDRRVARADDSGRVVLLAAGQADLIASAAGWRADTLRLYAVPIIVSDLAPHFVEDWRGGWLPDRWRAFGEPAPRVRPAGGPDGAGSFLNAGDAFFASGAMSQEPFALDQGLSVEVDARMPFTGKLHQEFGIALYGEAYADSLLATGDAPALAEFRVLGGSSTGPARAWIATPERRNDIPVPEGIDGWRTYTLQLLADGTVELIIDGRMYWRSPYRVARRATGAHVGLGFQSFETEILHGRVRVYAGRRYVLPEIPTAEGAAPPAADGG